MWALPLLRPNSTKAPVFTNLSTAVERSETVPSHERRLNDPEGAITAARTLLETVCKHMRDDAGSEASPYSRDVDRLNATRVLVPD